MRNIKGEDYNPTFDREDLPEPPFKTRHQLWSLHRKVQDTFLRRMDNKRVIAALRHMRLRDVKAGDIIFKQNEVSDTFYIVEEGEFHGYHHGGRRTFWGLSRDDMQEQRFSRCRSREQEVDLGERCWTYTAHETPCIGEWAIMYPYDRSTTVKAATDGKLWHISREVYTKIVATMAWNTKRRRMSYLDAVYLLSPLQNCEKVRLTDAIDSMCFSEDDLIFDEGDEADRIFLLEAGEVELVKATGERKVLKRGDCFGELALLTYRPRDASCRALTDCKVASLRVEEFERLQGKLKAYWDREPPGKFAKLCEIELGEANPPERIFR